MKKLSISEVPQWVADNYGIKPPTRQTIYNWIRVGKNGVKLRSDRKFGNVFTTEKWLHDFAQSL
jgi:hypothetical protein